MKNPGELKFYISFILLLAINFCSSQVKLSFKNDSGKEFKILKVELVKSTHIFKSLHPGESTLPITVNGSYPYCPMQIVTSTDTIKFIPIDYVGEKYYKSGKLKMILKISTGNPKRHIQITAKN